MTFAQGTSFTIIVIIGFFNYIFYKYTICSVRIIYCSTTKCFIFLEIRIYDAICWFNAAYGSSFISNVFIKSTILHGMLHVIGIGCASRNSVIVIEDTISGVTVEYCTSHNSFIFIECTVYGVSIGYSSAMFSSIVFIKGTVHYCTFSVNGPSLLVSMTIYKNNILKYYKIVV